MISTKSQLRNARFAQQRADEALRSGEDRANKKLISQGEVFPLRMAAEQAALDVANQENYYAATEQQFKDLTGQPAPAVESLPEEVPTMTYDRVASDSRLNQFLGQNVPDTPALEIMRKQIEVNQLNYLNQRKRLLPKLNFIMGLSQDEQSYTINSGLRYGVLSQYVGFSVNWQIFDGFATRGGVRTALAQKRMSEESYRVAVQNQRRQAEAAIRGIDLAYRQMSISDKILDNSQVFLKFRQEDFARGNAAEADVSAAQANYLSSLVSANNARVNFMLKNMEFVSLIARDPVVGNVKVR
ncbi:MAG: TolC family protein [Opitutaceae bacterium]|nr:TolC family protein [Opitutaceae bacterium]